MREAYRDAMNHIAVTEEMRVRILTNIQNTDLHAPKSRSHPFPVRYLAVAACFALLIAGAIALPGSRTPIQSENPSGVQNGILDKVDVHSLQALSQFVGFEVELLTELPFDVIETQYAAYGQDLAEVKYVGKTQSLVFHKIAGNTDPSGDYTAYSDTLILEVGRISVTLKGESGMYSLAVWQDGEYSYSLKSDMPFSNDEWVSILGTTS